MRLGSWVSRRRWAAVFPRAELLSQSFSRGSSCTLWNRDWGRGDSLSVSADSFYSALPVLQRDGVMITLVVFTGQQGSVAPPPLRSIIRSLQGRSACLPDTCLLITPAEQAQKGGVLQPDSTARLPGNTKTKCAHDTQTRRTICEHCISLFLRL